jgi:hypothetical protein
MPYEIEVREIKSKSVKWWKPWTWGMTEKQWKRHWYMDADLANQEEVNKFIDDQLNPIWRIGPIDS